MCWRAGYTTKCTGVESCGDFRGGGLTVLSCKSFFPRLVASLFVDSERALLLAGYGTPWVPFGVL
jgi:hypothetical protein